MTQPKSSPWLLKKSVWLNLHLCSWTLRGFVLSCTSQARNLQPGEGETEGKSLLSTASSWGKGEEQTLISSLWWPVTGSQGTAGRCFRGSLSWTLGNALDNTLRHIVWFLRLSQAGTKFGLNYLYGSLQIQDILLFYTSMIFRRPISPSFPITVPPAQLKAHVHHNRLVKAAIPQLLCSMMEHKGRTVSTRQDRDLRTGQGTAKAKCSLISPCWTGLDCHFMPLIYLRWGQDLPFTSSQPLVTGEDKEQQCALHHQMGLVGKRKSSILSVLAAFQGQIWGLTRSASTFLLSWNHRKSSSLSALAIHTKQQISSPL